MAPLSSLLSQLSFSLSLLSSSSSPLSPLSSLLLSLLSLSLSIPSLLCPDFSLTLSNSSYPPYSEPPNHSDRPTAQPKTPPSPVDVPPFLSTPDLPAPPSSLHPLYPADDPQSVVTPTQLPNPPERPPGYQRQTTLVAHLPRWTPPLHPTNLPTKVTTFPTTFSAIARQITNQHPF